MHTKLDLLSARVLVLALFSFCLASDLLTIAKQVPEFNRTGEVGYGDAYVLRTTQQLLKTGAIYESPETSKVIPPIAQYSPMLYHMMAAPARLASYTNPFTGPRVVAMFMFLMCVAAAAWLARALVPHPWAWGWSVLLALAMAPTRPWIIFLRGDFSGILFSLIAIRLLLAKPRWCVPLAGLAAGFATQFKVTYLSAMVAGCLWLVWQRRWRSAAQFSGAAVASSLGIYVMFALREPRMLSQMFSFGTGIHEYGTLLVFALILLREPVLLLGFAGLACVALRGSARWWLLTGYLLISLVVNTMFDRQAGGGINYFFEALFALVPLAAYGALRLARCRFGVAGIFLAGLLMFSLALPNATSALHAVVESPPATAAWNSHMNDIRGVFQGYRVLSFVPTATYLAPETVLSEPYLLTYLEQLGRIDSGPLQKRIRDREFDIVVTPATLLLWRGVPRLAPRLRPAIAETYQPFCEFQDWAIHLPRHSPPPGLRERLIAIGCFDTLPGVSPHSW